MRAFVEGAIGSTGGHSPDPYDIQSWTAELADAGCEAITLGVVRADHLPAPPPVPRCLGRQAT